MTANYGNPRKRKHFAKIMQDALSIHACLLSVVQGQGLFSLTLWNAASQRNNLKAPKAKSNKWQSQLLALHFCVLALTCRLFFKSRFNSLVWEKTYKKEKKPPDALGGLKWLMWGSEIAYRKERSMWLQGKCENRKMRELRLHSCWQKSATRLQLVLTWHSPIFLMKPRSKK